MDEQRGMTLWELVVAALVAGVVVGLGAPALTGLLLDARRTADINAFVLAIQLARNEAHKRARPVVLCKTLDRLRCGGREIRYDAGWMVFVNEDDIRPPHRAPGEALLYVHTPRMAGPIRSNRQLYEFRPFGWRSTNGTVTFCDERGEAGARAVIISYTGRPRTAATGPGGRALICA